MGEVWSTDAPPVQWAATGRGKYDWPAIVKELKTRPGEWMLVDPKARLGIQSAIKRQKMSALRDPRWDFEVTTRNNDREAGTCEIWMSATEREEI